MPDSTSTVTAEDLDALAEAWNRHDIDALMSLMTEDCVFDLHGNTKGRNAR